MYMRVRFPLSALVACDDEVGLSHRLVSLEAGVELVARVLALRPLLHG